jgi:hypothetical protein
MGDSMDAVTHDGASVGTTERVGQFTFTITAAEPTPEAQERWASNQGIGQRER